MLWRSSTVGRFISALDEHTGHSRLAVSYAIAPHANVICGVFLHQAAKKTRPTDTRETTFQGRCESIYGSSVPCAEESPTGQNI